MAGVPGGEFPYRSVLTVCAHPDDESFGLGAVLSTFAGLGIQTRVLCFTHGETSTLGASGVELTVVRAAELAAAAAVLGVTSLRLLSYPDGALSAASLEELCLEVETSAALHPVDCLLVFDQGGITGHPDHQRATEAALATGERLGVPVLAWALPTSIAAALNDEFATGFVGREPSEIDLVIEVDRALQYEAISCHTSQSTDNPVLWRRLTLQGTTESLRWLSARCWSPTDWERSHATDHRPRNRLSNDRRGSLDAVERSTPARH
jgi:LmbE family N-acetylglucosaminyl deacetylase